MLAFLPDLSFASGQAGSQPKVSSVAVLNFRAPAGDEALTSFGLDLAEDLSNLLVRSGMQVSAQSAVLALGPAVAPQEAGQKLSVNAVFAGSIRVSGDQVKVRVELVDARNGFQIWSDTMTSSRAELSASEPKTAEEILSRMRTALSEIGRAHV